MKREGYPEEGPDQLTAEPTQTKVPSVLSHAAHTITILPPVVLVNLLPCDLNFLVKNVSVRGNIKAGKSFPLYAVSFV